MLDSTCRERRLQLRVRELKAHLPKLVSRKAAFIKAVSFKMDLSQEPFSVRSLAAVVAIQLKAAALPKCSGNQRDYYRWRKELEALQEQREPTGSKELHIFQPLDSLDKKVARDLLLSSLITPHQKRSSES